MPAVIHITFSPGVSLGSVLMPTRRAREPSVYASEALRPPCTVCTACGMWGLRVKVAADWLAFEKPQPCHLHSPTGHCYPPATLGLASTEDFAAQHSILSYLHLCGAMPRLTICISAQPKAHSRFVRQEGEAAARETITRLAYG